MGKKEGLIQAMFHGKKLQNVASNEEVVSEHQGLRALLLLILRCLSRDTGIRRTHAGTILLIQQKGFHSGKSENR